MNAFSATAQASPNIALIKYWGNRDDKLRIPSSGSISMNLGWLQTRTRVTFTPGLTADELFLNGEPLEGSGLERVQRFLDIVRGLAGVNLCAHVTSENNFPTGAGIASSAAAFAALALAATTALGLRLTEIELSRLARRGSGSACRSIPGGFVEWQAGENDLDSYAFSLAQPDHWDLVDCIAVVDASHKPVVSSQGHMLAGTSPLQTARVADAPRRLDLCRRALLARDFDALTEIVELDSQMMHAVMMTSTPPLLYWSPATITVLHAVPLWRGGGLPACATIDAGPNVHVLTLSDRAEEVARRLSELSGVTRVIPSPAGGPAQLVDE